jgi:hypothetical protein
MSKASTHAMPEIAACLFFCRLGAIQHPIKWGFAKSSMTDSEEISMSCLGVHFALSDDDVAALLSKQSDADRLAMLKEIEDRYFVEPRLHMAESDKAWDAMHRSLADGLLDYD